MKTSIFLAASGAVLAAAGIVDFEKRYIETKTVEEVVYVTVTAGDHKMMGPGHHKFHHKTTTPCTTSKTIAKAVKPTYKAKPAPAPTYKAKPAPANNVGPAPSDYSSTGVWHHNQHRSNHSSPELSWSPSLASYAAQAAQACVFAHNLKPGGGGYGQNIAMYGGSSAKGMDPSKLLAQAITDMWYNGELHQFPASGYGQATPDMSHFEGWGHITQVVWASSTEVGCATQFCHAGTIVPGMDSWFTVCNYNPPGNMGGQYGKNFGHPLGHPGISA